MKYLFFQNYENKEKLSDQDLMSENLKMNEYLDKIENLIYLYNNMQGKFKIDVREMNKNYFYFDLSMNISNEMILKENYKIILNNERKAGFIKHGIDLKIYIKFNIYRKILQDSFLREYLSRNLKISEYDKKFLKNALLENQYLMDIFHTAKLNPELEFESNAMVGQKWLKSKLLLEFSDILDVNLRTLVTQFSLHFNLINKLIIDDIIKNFFTCDYNLDIYFVINSLNFVFNKIRTFFTLPNLEVLTRDNEMTVLLLVY